MMDATIEMDFKMDCITTDFVFDPHRTANEIEDGWSSCQFPALILL